VGAHHGGRPCKTKFEERAQHAAPLKDKFEWAKLCAQPEATRAHPTGEAEVNEDRTGCGIYTGLREFVASADPARF